MLTNDSGKKSVLGKIFQRPGIKVVLATTLVVGGVTVYSLSGLNSSKSSSSQTETIAPLEIKTVTALGRLEPKGEVIKLSAAAGNNGNRVDRLLVEEGDQVKANQVIAILDSHDRLLAALEQAKEDVRVAQAKLAITLSGAKEGEISAQKAEISRIEAQKQGDAEAQKAIVSRLESEFQNAEVEYNRYQNLYDQGAISASQRDNKRLTRDTAKKSLEEARVLLARIEGTSVAQLNQAKANLERVSEVRPVDVEADQVGVSRAVAAMNQIKAELELAYVRSPLDGEILYIHTRSGEVVSNDGIVEIGKTQQMEAVAEVYQSDVSKIRLGQRVRIISDAIPEEMFGTVERIGSQVRRQTIINTDPSTNIDSRVVEVRVTLDKLSSQKAAKFTNAQVKVVIEK